MNIARGSGAAPVRPNVKLPADVTVVPQAAPQTKEEIIAWLRAELPAKDTDPVHDEHARGSKEGWNSALQRATIAVDKLERLWKC